MSGMCCPCVLLTRYTFLNYRRKDIIITSSFAAYLSSKQIRNNSDSVIPVKLSYISYESMNGNENNSKYPVIVMHGLFGSKTNWNTLSKVIHQQTHRKVITIDARNHGDSPQSSDMTYRHMAQDVVQLMNDLGFEKSTLIGHSMGGSTMMYVALNFPHLVEKLIVVDMSPVSTSPSLLDMQQIFKAMRMINFENVPSITKARALVKDQLAHVIKSTSIRQFLAMNIVEADIGKFKWRINLPVLDENFATQIAVFPDVRSKTFVGPTLFIGGSKSDYIKIKDHRKIKQFFPRATFVYIDGAHHWVHVDKPAEFLKLTTHFINQP